jgi:Tol biopolymer transport system component
MAAPRRLSLLVAAVLPLSVLLPVQSASAAAGNEVVHVLDADNDGVYALVSRDLDTGAITELLPADTTRGYLYDDPEFSPNGAQVLVATDYQGPGQPGLVNVDKQPVLGLAVVNRDGTGFRRLTTPQSSTTSSSEDSFGAWSPDGSTILFTRITETTDAASNVTSASQLMTVPAAGGTPTTVPGATNGFTGDFNPADGSQIVYAEVADLSSGVGPLNVISTSGADKRSLGVTGALPSWSPDGSTIAYAAITDPDPNADTDADVAQIGVVPAAGGSGTIFPSTRPTSARSVAEYPTWSPDGQSILYDLYTYDASGGENSGDIWAVGRDGSSAARLIAGPGDEAQPAPAPGANIAAARDAAVCDPTVVPSRTELTVGQEVVIDVSGIPAGRRVSLIAYSRPSTEYKEVRPLTAASSGGTVRYTVKPGTNTRFRVQVEGCAQPSSTQALTVHPVLSLQATRLGTKSYRFSGLILPAAANVGRAVGLYYQPSGGNRILKGKASIDSSGRYTVDLRFTGTGRFNFFFESAQSLNSGFARSNIRNLLVY